MRSASALAMLVVASAARLAAAQTLTREPYVQLATPTSMVVVWRTNPATDAVVRYGTDVAALTSTVSDPIQATQHEVTLTGLTPGTRYYYEVGDGAGALGGGTVDHTFVTAPLPGSVAPFRIWVLGDSGRGNPAQLEVRDAALAAWAGMPPSFALHAGDVAYESGLDSEFQANYFDVYAAILRSTPMWPAIGNHDLFNADSATESGPYYDAFVLPRAGEAGGVPSGTEAYYSFDYANAHVIILDSADSPRRLGSVMLDWLQADLAATTQTWKIAVFHHPPYSKGHHDSDVEKRNVEMRHHATPLLEAGGVDLVLGGHSHLYERSYLVAGAYDTPTTAAGHVIDGGDGRLLGDGPYVMTGFGAVYLTVGHGGTSVSGTGGHPLNYFTEIDNGSCLIDVDGDVLTLRNIRRDGVQTDELTLTKQIPAGVRVLYPAAGTAHVRGTPMTIRWYAGASIASVRLDYSLDDGATWLALAPSTPNDGAFVWGTPAVLTDLGRVRISDASTPGISDTSAVFRLIDPPELAITFGDTWKYHDQGVDLGATWMTPGYDDSAWPQGLGQLGYGNGDEATLLYDTSPNIPSVYFRRTVTLSATPDFARVTIVYDDAFAVWVNGARIFSIDVSDDSFGVYGDGTSGDNAVQPFGLPAGALVAGDNVIAVMIKQSAATSPDLSFDLQLELFYPRASCVADPDCGPGFYCDPTSGCAGQVARGESCSDARYCASGFCADGVCCDAACVGPCEACSVTGAIGTCVAVLGAPVAPRPPCDGAVSPCGGRCDGIERDACTFAGPATPCRAASCAGDVEVYAASCDGAGSCPAPVSGACAPYRCGASACATTCATATDCAPGLLCPAGACVPPVVDGDPCTDAAQCGSGRCIDGVCCSGPCGEPCMACNLVGSRGICALVTGAPVAPRPPCADDGGGCGGTCDGASPSCTYPGASTACRAASCAGDVEIAPAGCDGQGGCPPVVSTACAPYTCGADSCLSECSGDFECELGYTCDGGGACQPIRIDGLPCASDDECTSRHCVDGVCCASDCGGQCEACDVLGLEGDCVAVSGAPRPSRSACADDGSGCGGACDGVERTGCAYPDAAVVCMAASCTGGVAVLAAGCDGSGACPALVTMACAPYECDRDRCHTSCSGDSDCQTGYLCANGGACELPASGADGDACATHSDCSSGHCVDGVCCASACRGQCEACNREGFAGVCTPVSGAPVGGRPGCVVDANGCADQCDGVVTSSCAEHCDPITPSPPPPEGCGCAGAGLDQGLLALAALAVLALRRRRARPSLRATAR